MYVYLSRNVRLVFFVLDFFFFLACVSLLGTYLPTYEYNR